MLWQDFMGECVRLERTSTPDSQGGQTTSWRPSKPFEAAVVRDSATVSTVADRAEPSAEFTVTTQTPLSFHDVIRRESDGLVVRVTSEAIETPGMASFAFVQYKAERWEVPND